MREQGAWLDWLAFFLDAVTMTAEASSDTIRRILQLFAASRSRVQGLGRNTASALRVLDILERSPIVSITSVAGQLGMSFPAISAALTRLEEHGIVRELSGQARGRVYAYDAYLTLLSEGTEPLAAR